MTGPEHYKEAERLVAGAAEIASPTTPTSVIEALTSMAQVHAALAGVAAYVDAHRLDDAGSEADGTRVVSEWGKAVHGS